MIPGISIEFEQKISLTGQVFRIHVAADQEGVFFTPLTEKADGLDFTWEEIYTILKRNKKAMFK